MGIAYCGFRHGISVRYTSHRQAGDDDFQVYVWKSVDFGETWSDISANIPVGPVNVIREDIVNPDILYLGTDGGAFVSKDGENPEYSLRLPLPMCTTLPFIRGIT
ncbi:MAG: hypothetical protein R2727_11485 [Bacteroidales bacterium]